MWLSQLLAPVLLSQHNMHAVQQGIHTETSIVHHTYCYRDGYWKVFGQMAPVVLKDTLLAAQFIRSYICWYTLTIGVWVQKESMFDTLEDCVYSE